MDGFSVLVVIIASVISAITMHVYDRNKDGKITKEEIKETIEETFEKK